MAGKCVWNLRKKFYDGWQVKKRFYDGLHLRWLASREEILIWLTEGRYFKDGSHKNKGESQEADS